eukprot:7731465-Alexandrium_andersonii.AAC.1
MPARRRRWRLRGWARQLLLRRLAPRVLLRTRAPRPVRHCCSGRAAWLRYYSAADHASCRRAL